MRRFAFVRHTITLLALTATSAFAQTTHYSVHAGRFSMPGVDEAEMARMQQMMGGAMPQQSGPAGAFSFGKNLHLRLTKGRTAIPEALHALPPGGQLPPAVTLVPSGGTYTDEAPEMEKPNARISIYWGCGDTVRAGQPMVIDTSKLSQADFAKRIPWQAGAQGPRCPAGQACWPNERDKRTVPFNSSLVGDHKVNAAGVPNINFALAGGQDFMDRFTMRSSGDAANGIQVSWDSMANARAYFLMAAEGNEKGRANEVVIWTSAEIADMGSASFTYIPGSVVTRWLASKLMLPASTTQCTIPKGVFKTKDVAVMGSAYGPEAYFSNPPRPANAGANWAPEWSATVRYASYSITGPGMDERNSTHSNRASRNSNNAPSAPGAPDQSGQSGQSESLGPSGATGAVIKGAGEALKGIFGR